MYMCMHAGASARMRVYVRGCMCACKRRLNEGATQCIYTKQCLVGALALPLRATTQLSWTAYNVGVGTALAEGIGTGTDKRSHQDSSGLSCRTPWSGLARLMGACRRAGSAGRPLHGLLVR